MMIKPKPPSAEYLKSVRIKKEDELRQMISDTPDAPLSIITAIWDIFPTVKPDWNEEAKKLYEI